MTEDKIRCPWCGADPLYVNYHDLEWGVPVHDDKKHFEFLVLESAQAGLSWITILRRRENYRMAYLGFDPEKVAEFGPSEIEKLLQDEGIIRNRRKIESSISNAALFIEICREFGSFDNYMRGFVENGYRKNNFSRNEEIPVYTEEAEACAKDLKKRGFKFLGPTVIYAHMQAAGIVNDHLVSCFRHSEVGN